MARYPEHPHILPSRPAAVTQAEPYRQATIRARRGCPDARLPREALPRGQQGEHSLRAVTATGNAATQDKDPPRVFAAVAKSSLKARIAEDSVETRAGSGELGLQGRKLPEDAAAALAGTNLNRDQSISGKIREGNK